MSELALATVRSSRFVNVLLPSKITRVFIQVPGLSPGNFCGFPDVLRARALVCTHTHLHHTTAVLRITHTQIMQGC